MGNKAKGIKAENKEQILEALSLLDHNRINPPMSKIYFLMDEYNKALGMGQARYREEDLWCGDCRKAVVHFWRNIRDTWKKME
jgi:hypothetical protein